MNDILYVEGEAFQRDLEVKITRDMLSDPSAKPILSLLAYIENKPVGHILFTNGYIEGNPQINVSFLAPLAVIPDFQRQGIGGALINEGVKKLSKMGLRLVCTRTLHSISIAPIVFLPASVGNKAMRLISATINF